MKIYVFSFFGNCSNDLSYCYDSKMSGFVSDKDDLSFCFKELRKEINKGFKNILKGNLSSYKNYRFTFMLTIIDTKNKKTRFKNFHINPLNLKG